MKVRFTREGRHQFLCGLEYIRRDNPTAAFKFRKRAEAVLRRLEDFPESGRVIPEFAELPFREVIVPPYRFFYRIAEDCCWVVSVWHGAQIPRSPSVD